MADSPRHARKIHARLRIPAAAFVALALGCGALSGCGYTLQRSRSDALEKEGVARVYVKPLVNNTYKPGVENVVYNALIRALLSYRRVEVVTSEESADAVLQGTVGTAQFVASGSTNAAALPPGGLSVSQDVQIATVYTAVLGCNFSLKRRKAISGKKSILWTGGFSRSKPFPSANQLDVPGTTSALINESEFDRALSEIAYSMMYDVQESMLAMF